MTQSILSGFSVAPNGRRLAALFAAFLIPALLAGGSAAAQDSTRMKQLRLLCAQLSGDLMDPGGIAAFRRCLTTHNPLGEIARDNGIGGRRIVGGLAPITDRIHAAPPAGFGRNSRDSLAQGSGSFQIMDGKVVYLIAADGKLWRSTMGTKDAHVIAQSVAMFRVAGDGQVFELGSDGALWRMGADSANRVLIDQGVADFQPLDGNAIYVRGKDGKLWRENGSSASRALIDQQVAQFQAVAPNLVFVLGADGKLWRETGDMHTRSLIAGLLRAFQYVPDGDTVYVLSTGDQLWRQTEKDKPEHVDHDVAAFRAADMNLVYVLGKDGRLWQELGNRDQAVLVDRDVMVGLGPASFQAADAHHVYVVDRDRKLWSETMSPGR